MEKKQEELDDLYSRFRELMRLAMSGEKTVMLTDDLPEPVIHQFESVYMIPGWTHNIINLSKTDNLVTIMTCNEIFNKDKPDTFFEIVK